MGGRGDNNTKEKEEKNPKKTTGITKREKVV
jgi:hypothetical protein